MSRVFKKRVYSFLTLATPFGLRVAMSGGDHLLSGGTHVRRETQSTSSRRRGGPGSGTAALASTHGGARGARPHLLNEWERSRDTELSPLHRSRSLPANGHKLHKCSTASLHIPY
ncbi:hypothetical protein EVAR_6627_1 [Eumeta japonica]|uniref:Uncharacterized protein n=1 Tax=Eumeta variegata TaxID=151549 RepID=A0A4C1TN72_EUMVA|nr:hypothetical protein EVAR_6627_1 [Eumeta japonica]